MYFSLNYNRVKNNNNSASFSPITVRRRVTDFQTVADQNPRGMNPSTSLTAAAAELSGIYI